MKKSVLVTGSEGFTGRYLMAELEAAGYGVVGIGSHASAFLVDIQTGLNRQRFLEV
jgi:nucleoside-diphosphate-sugar epimerase